MMTCCCIFCQYSVPPEQGARKRELLQRRRSERREMPWLFGFLDRSKIQVECRGRVELAGHPGALILNISAYLTNTKRPATTKVYYG